MVAAACDRIEIGHIEALEGSDAHQSTRHAERIAAARQRRREGPLVRALAHAGAHDRAAHQIENRNDLHGSRLVQATDAGCIVPRRYHTGGAVGTWLPWWGGTSAARISRRRAPRAAASSMPW